MDSNKKIQTILTPVKISLLNSILNITCKITPSCRNSCDQPNLDIFSLNPISYNSSESEELYEQELYEQEVNPIIVQDVNYKVKTVGKHCKSHTTVKTCSIVAEYSVSNYDDWLVVRYNNN